MFSYRIMMTVTKLVIITITSNTVIDDTNTVTIVSIVKYIIITIKSNHSVLYLWIVQYPPSL